VQKKLTNQKIEKKKNILIFLFCDLKFKINSKKTQINNQRLIQVSSYPNNIHS